MFKKVDVSKNGRAALAYAEQLDWAVLPLHSVRDGRCTCGTQFCSSSGKHPRTRNGVKDATKDHGAIAVWWKRWPYANIGVASGAVSGFFVLDVDGDAGRESMQELERAYGPLPHTVEQITGSLGRHLFFRYPDNGMTIGNRVAIAPGIDLRGDGGYIVAPPSAHLSGRRYWWEISSRPDEVPLADAPAWLLKLVAQPRKTAGRGEAGWQQFFDRGAPEGERNAAIASIAGYLINRQCYPAVVIELVRSWNQVRCRPPLTDAEVIRTVESIIKTAAHADLTAKKAVVELHVCDETGALQENYYDDAAESLRCACEAWEECFLPPDVPYYVYAELLKEHVLAAIDSLEEDVLACGEDLEEDILAAIDSLNERVLAWGEDLEEDVLASVASLKEDILLAIALLEEDVLAWNLYLDEMEECREEYWKNWWKEFREDYRGYWTEYLAECLEEYREEYREDFEYFWEEYREDFEYFLEEELAEYREFYEYYWEEYEEYEEDYINVDWGVCWEEYAKQYPLVREEYLKEHVLAAIDSLKEYVLSWEEYIEEDV